MRARLGLDALESPKNVPHEAPEGIFVGHDALLKWQLEEAKWSLRHDGPVDDFPLVLLLVLGHVEDRVR